ncbi:hypothetical protein JQC67_16265 [Aurantibacter crassamenti]|uniref:hypothetical protein n=1 Tax=Aurantibacter crassamenti TaxID=1837375 RepID=UPI0019399EE5|nr:hypothetical protein [Aurantibacter crassamenti]MBM1107712.1 hypothetical protein [Aurantibacter crassamenti]
MRTTYSSFEEIRKDLRKLSLQRQIAFEEIKGLKQEVQEDFSSDNWMHTAFDAFKKFGILYIIRSIFKK